MAKETKPLLDKEFKKENKNFLKKEEHIKGSIAINDKDSYTEKECQSATEKVVLRICCFMCVKI
ncbi:MAG: hypothetical protein K5659_01610 [Lachnospiraceae bacterium]|nr:hypothetical protein [Lachnospiraceae bacterium]